MPLSIIFQLYRGGILIRTIAISKIHETPKYKIIKKIINTKNTIKTCKYKKCFDQSLIYCPIFGNQDCILDFEGHYECQIFMIDENFQKRPFKVVDPGYPKIFPSFNFF